MSSRKICPITYEEIPSRSRYSPAGLKLLSPQLKDLKDLPYTATEQRRQAEVHATKLSIQGIQPKLSAKLSIKNASFQLVDQGGRYILKPQAERYQRLPENEDLTMRLASTAGIEVPMHGLVRSKDGSFTYFIRRFDREGQRRKLHVEDFAQLTGESRDTKYDSSMEKVAGVLDFCTFPAIEAVKLLKRALFSFLVGNEDMHLKNFSLWVRDGTVELSPAYDLVNTTIALASPKEELALPIRGKKRKLTRNDFIDYFGIERLKIQPAVCDSVLDQLKRSLPRWADLIHASFLDDELKTAYLGVLQDRSERLGIL